MLDFVLKCDILKIKRLSFSKKLGLSQGGNKMERKMTGILEACVVMALIALLATNALGQTKWTKYEGNPIALDPGAPGEWDDTYAVSGPILFDDGIYKMWYGGGDDVCTFRTGYATSDDGITWTKYEGNPVLDLGASGEWDEHNVIAASVLFENGIYKMWYSGEDGSNTRIGYATSSATIDIRTDKLIYHEGDPMTVYADVVNIDSDVPDALLVLHFVTLFRAFPVQIIPFDMPANFESYDWEVFTIDSLPSLRRRSYAYLGVLASQSEGILAADIAFWTFSSSLSVAEEAHLRKVAEEYLWNLNVADLSELR